MTKEHEVYTDEGEYFDATMEFLSNLLQTNLTSIDENDRKHYETVVTKILSGMVFDELRSLAKPNVDVAVR